MQDAKTHPLASRQLSTPSLEAETGKPLSVSLSKLLFSLLEQKAQDKDARAVIGLAKELRELIKINLEFRKFEHSIKEKVS